MSTFIRTAILCTILFTSYNLRSQIQDLFISEYVEGNSFNKAIEIYNGTSAPIDLGLGQYRIESYFNGSTTSSSFALTGTISAGGTKVIAHPSATLGITPDFTTTVINFNGNDAIVLRKNGSTGPVLDVIGQVGFNPGTQWGSNDTCTLDRTLRRKIFICQGETNTGNVFYVSPEWDGFPINTFNGLGTHSTTCGTATSGSLVLSPPTLSFTGILNVSSSPQALTLIGYSLTSNAVVSVPAPFAIAQSTAGPFVPTLTLGTAGSNFTTITLFANYTPTSPSAITSTVSATAGTFSASVLISGYCNSLTPIPAIQGTASASGYTNQIVVTEGIVTAAFQGTNQLGGFYLQDTLGDNNPLTSDAVYVSNTTFQVNAGDFIRLSATVEEYFNRTQLHSVSVLTVISSGYTVSPVTFTLPSSDLEGLENMVVLNTQTLTVNEVYNLARYGEAMLSNGRRNNPTNSIDPNDPIASGTTFSGTTNVAAITAQQLINNQNKVILDDASNVQNPPIVPYLDPVTSTLRCGSTVPGFVSILDYAFSNYRLQPIQTPSFSFSPRPALPSVGNHNVKIASLNVLNYFNGNGSGGGFPTSRGASTSLEFSRQRVKLFEALKAIDADVVGLMEMENDGDGALSAINDFVTGLNSLIGTATYSYIADPSLANGGTGSDEIKVALIYKFATVAPFGVSYADSTLVFDRHPLAQTFTLNSNGEKFSVIVNHFKSKSCGSSTLQNTDQNDGQGCYNYKRITQALRLTAFADTVKSRSQDQDVVLMGDFNAYGEEDPLDVFRANGWQHLLPNSYSYVFDGQNGSLDHIFVSPTMSVAITGAEKWHINSDEPIAKDYNQEFNPAYMYSPDAFRCSDHDPVVLGLKLEAPVLTGVLNSGKKVGFKTSPNPVQRGEGLLLQSSSKIIALRLYDLSGTCLQEKEFQTAQSQYTLPTAQLVPGIYFLCVTKENGDLSSQLISIQ